MYLRCDNAANPGHCEGLVTLEERIAAVRLGDCSYFQFTTIRTQPVTSVVTDRKNEHVRRGETELLSSARLSSGTSLGFRSLRKGAVREQTIPIQHISLFA